MMYDKGLPHKIDDLENTYKVIEPYKLKMACREYDLALIQLYTWLTETKDDGTLKNSYKKLNFTDYDNDKKKKTIENQKRLGTIFKRNKLVNK